ncbi:uncharacterized protein LOC141909306 [Tubulanus polymorphus]|uniref:uncharacterized protein LOC141909306 n=1 Tax=Tubulanus polymorphus TaxID=672921 RepID=UPI003DA32C13
MATPDGIHHVTIETSRDTDYQEFLDRIDSTIAARSTEHSSGHDPVTSEAAVVPGVGQTYGDHRIIDDLYSPMLVLDGGEIPSQHIEDTVKNQIQALITNISGRLPSKNREEFSDDDEEDDGDDDDDDDQSMTEEDVGEHNRYDENDDNDMDIPHTHYQMKTLKSKPKKRHSQPAFTTRNYSMEYLKNAAEFQKKKTITACSLQITDPSNLVEMKSIKSKSKARRIVQVGQVPELKPEKPKPYKCRLCSKSFGTSSNLRLHERTHTGKRPYKCVVCKKSFSHKSNLNRHERIHTGYLPYVCGYCGKGFAQSTGCKEHVKLHLLNADKLLFPCNRCTKRFSTQNHLNDHLNLHDYQSKVHVCPECGESFTPLSALNHHMKIHTGSDNFICQICGASFSQCHNLTIHMRRHAEFKPFQCDWCGIRFCRMSDLTKHEDLHLREESGGKRLQNRLHPPKRLPNSIEEREEKLRMNEKLTCRLCGERFRSESVLKCHEKQHGKEFCCDMCDRQFSRSGDLKRHITTVHGPQNSDDDADRIKPNRNTRGAKQTVAKKDRNKRLDAQKKRENRRKAKKGKPSFSEIELTTSSRGRKRKASLKVKENIEDDDDDDDDDDENEDEEEILPQRRSSRRRRNTVNDESPVQPQRIIVRLAKQKAPPKTKSGCGSKAKKGCSKRKQTIKKEIETKEDLAAILVQVGESVAPKSSDGEQHYMIVNDSVDLNESTDHSALMEHLVAVQNKTESNSVNDSGDIVQDPSLPQGRAQTDHFERQYQVTDPNVSGTVMMETDEEMLEFEIVHMDENNMIISEDAIEGIMSPMRLLTQVVQEEIVTQSDDVKSKISQNSS